MTSFWRYLRHAFCGFFAQPASPSSAGPHACSSVSVPNRHLPAHRLHPLRKIPSRTPEELGTIRIADRHVGGLQPASSPVSIPAHLCNGGGLGADPQAPGRIRRHSACVRPAVIWLLGGGPNAKASRQRRFLSRPWREPILGAPLLVRRMTSRVAAPLQQTSVTPLARGSFAGDPSVVGKR